MPALTAYEQASAKIQSLQEMLLANNPSMPMLLRDIHQTLKSDAEVVSLLTDEDIGVLMKGLSKHAMVTITTSAKKASVKSVSKLGLDDL